MSLFIGTLFGVSCCCVFLDIKKIKWGKFSKKICLVLLLEFLFAARKSDLPFPPFSLLWTPFPCHETRASLSVLWPIIFGWRPCTGGGNYWGGNGGGMGARNPSSHANWKGRERNRKAREVGPRLNRPIFKGHGHGPPGALYVSLLALVYLS